MARPNSFKRPTDMKKTLSQLFTILGHHKWYLALVSILVIISGSANLIGTYSIKNVINFAAEGKIDEIISLCIKVGLCYFAGALSTLIYTQIMVKLSQSIVYEMREDLLKKVERLEIKFFDTTSYGDIMSCFTNDVETVSEAFNNSFASMIENFVQLVGTIVCLFLLSDKLSYIVIVFYLIMFTYLVYAGKRTKYYFKKQQEALGELSGFTEENIRGIKVVKVFNHEEESYKRFAEKSANLTKVSYKALTYSNSMVPMVMALSYINYTIVALLGGIFALNGVFDIGILASYLVFVRQAALPINRFTYQANIILNSLASMERIFSFINLSPEADKGKVKVVTKDDGSVYFVKEDGEEVLLRGDIRFHNVTFSYQKGKTILNDISLYAKPGQKIALVGSTGAGKTTITNLINRFYDIDEGEILYDGINVKDIAKSDLRKTLGMVLQDTHLFTGTIADNIRFGKLDASDEEVVKAAKLANADYFISHLPESYNTVLTSDGSNLSQGQRQLIAIARAAISNPSVLILDEATSSIDTHTEKLIQEGMDKLMENRTVFVIAHRLSTVANANAIIVLEKGKIIERGDHDELIKHKGHYYQLCTGKKELA